METVVAIIAFAVCALAFEDNVTQKVEDGPVSDQEFAAAVEFEKQNPAVRDGAPCATSPGRGCSPSESKGGQT